MVQMKARFSFAESLEAQSGGATAQKDDSSADASRASNNRKSEKERSRLLYLTSKHPKDQSCSIVSTRKVHRSCCLGEHCTGGTSIPTAAFPVRWAKGLP